MSDDSLLEKLILNHCWQIYEMLYSNFSPAARFSSEFLSAVELALVTNLFQLSLEIDAAKHVLHIREEWKSEDYKLTVLSKLTIKVIHLHIFRIIFTIEKDVYALFQAIYMIL